MKNQFIWVLTIIHSLVVNVIQAQNLTHDNLNRLSSITYADSTTITYSYDQVGNRVTQQIYNPTNLPIELTSFDVREEDCTVQLTWQSASEINASHYEVQHSTNGTNFTSIERIEATGSATLGQYYQYTHPQPADGANYYRLRMVDIGREDEKVYSTMKAVAVRNCHSKNLRLYPNPVIHSIVHVEFNGEENIQQIRVYASNGQLLDVPINVLSGQLWKLNTEKLPSGKYHVQVSLGASGALKVTKSFTVP